MRRGVSIHRSPPHRGVSSIPLACDALNPRSSKTRHSSSVLHQLDEYVCGASSKSQSSGKLAQTGTGKNSFTVVENAQPQQGKGDRFFCLEESPRPTHAQLPSELGNPHFEGRSEKGCLLRIICCLLQKSTDSKTSSSVHQETEISDFKPSKNSY